MKNKLLAEIAYSALTDDLCEGCDKYDSPFSYENGGSCQLCRRMAAKEIKSFLERRKDGDHAEGTIQKERS